MLTIIVKKQHTFVKKWHMSDILNEQLHQWTTPPMNNEQFCSSNCERRCPIFRVISQQVMHTWSGAVMNCQKSTEICWVHTSPYLSTNCLMMVYSQKHSRMLWIRQYLAVKTWKISSQCRMFFLSMCRNNNNINNNNNNNNNYNNDNLYSAMT